MNSSPDLILNSLAWEFATSENMGTMTIEDFTASIDEGAYTSVGSYPKFATNKRDECICWECVERDYNLIVAAIVDPEIHSEYRGVEVAVNWENAEMYCELCSCRIHSAYAEPEEESITFDI
jgi:hypothetical protein